MVRLRVMSADSSTAVHSAIEGVPTTPPPSTGVNPALVSPWVLFGGVFFVASVGGLAALLRSGQELNKRLVLSALLNSGIVGIIVATGLWRRYGAEDPALLFCVSVLAGFGGATSIDLIFQVAKKWIDRWFRLSGDQDNKKP